MFGASLGIVKQQFRSEAIAAPSQAVPALPEGAQLYLPAPVLELLHALQDTETPSAYHHFRPLTTHHHHCPTLASAFTTDTTTNDHHQSVAHAAPYICTRLLAALQLAHQCLTRHCSACPCIGGGGGWVAAMTLGNMCDSGSSIDWLAIRQLTKHGC